MNISSESQKSAYQMLHGIMAGYPQWPYLRYQYYWQFIKGGEDMERHLVELDQFEITDILKLVQEKAEDQKRIVDGLNEMGVDPAGSLHLLQGYMQIIEKLKPLLANKL